MDHDRFATVSALGLPTDHLDPVRDSALLDGHSTLIAVNKQRVSSAAVARWSSPADAETDGSRAGGATAAAAPAATLAATLTYAVLPTVSRAHPGAFALASAAIARPAHAAGDGGATGAHAALRDLPYDDDAGAGRSAVSSVSCVSGGVYAVPYSLHASFPELRDFVVRPRATPTKHE